MADTVFSVRIDEALKNRFMELAQENGVNNKDLMQLLVTQFELGQIGAGTDGFAQDIDELQRLTKRIADLYIHMVERSQLRELERKNHENHQLHQQQEEIEQLKEQLTQLEEKERLIQQLKDQVKGLKQEVATQKDEERNLKDLNELLREKNSKLEKRFAEVEVKLESAESLLVEVTNLKAKLADQEEANRQLQTKIEVMKSEALEQNKNVDMKLKQQQQAFDQEIELMNKKHALELQELRLSMQADYFKQLEQLKEEQAKKLQVLTDEKEALNQKLIEKKQED